MVLLDTCTLLWLAADQKKLSDKAKRTIKEHAGLLCISAISAFEIALKCRSRKIVLPLPALEWFERTLDYHGIKELPVTSAVAVTSVQLPLLHNDPCDRIIIATAKMDTLPVLTCDQLIFQYKEVQVIW